MLHAGIEERSRQAIAVLNNVGVPPLPIEIFDILFERPYSLPTAPAP